MNASTIFGSPVCSRPLRAARAPYEPTAQYSFKLSNLGDVIKYRNLILYPLTLHVLLLLKYRFWAMPSWGGQTSCIP